jgi:hypothetical protein
METNRFFRFLVVFTLLGMTLPVQSAFAGPAESAAPAELLQFSSGGHALGFAADGVYAAAGDHALHVAFMGANAVRPQSDSPAGQDGNAAPLGRVVYENLWNGITLAYSSNEGSIYTTAYTLAPGADPAAIRLQYNAPLSVKADGTLSIVFSSGALTESAPIAWQNIGGERVPVEASFQVSGREVLFALGAYDRSCALTIDPALVWNTFLGGSSIDYGGYIAVDADGSVYVAGHGYASWGTPVRAFTGGNDAFVAKLNPSGTLVWNTFLGGSNGDEADGIAVDANRNVYVTGYSDATWEVPVRAFAGSRDAFAAKLYSTGSLAWNSFLGESGDNRGMGIAVDGSGNVWVSGRSGATWGSPEREYTGGFDAFAAKLNSSGVLVWNTFLGGSGDDNGRGIAVGADGKVYVAGDSNSAWGDPVRAFTGTGLDVFVAKLASSGGLDWNTFLGGNGTDIGNGIAVDGSGNAYVTGYSPATWGSPLRAFTGLNDVMVAKVNSSGALVWNTFLGGSDGDRGFAVTLDRGGNIYVAGDSSATWGSPLRAFAGGHDAFAAKLRSSGALVSSAFLGGSDDDYGHGIAVDGSGAYVAGYSDASWGSPLRAYSGSSDVFAARVTLPHTCSLEERELYDFTGDCRTDLAVYRPSTGAWYLRNAYSLYFGASGDVPVAGDYNGDGVTDIAVYRPSTGAWYVRNQLTAYFGSAGDLPVPGDYNGDGTTEIAVYRPATGAWYIRGQATVYYGASADIPVPGDYNNDGEVELAVYRPSTGAWYIRGESTIYHGVSTDVPVPGDYDGNGSVDIAVFRPSSGAWYVRGRPTIYFGSSGDIAVPGDYDGDGDTDIAVFRPSTGAWYVRGQSTVFYGASGDIPLPEMGTGRAGTAP